MVNDRPVSAHRLAWEAANGRPVPDGLLVLHSCDNPPCVNPAHLRAGTHRENMGDKVARGRVRAGAAHGRAVLTEADVYEIRRLRADRSATCRELAERYGVSMTQISNIARGLSWRHLPPHEVST
jgi:hypothetical protein